MSYLRMADGLDPIEHPPGHFPGGYPFVLAVLQAIGAGPVGSGRWIGVATAAAVPALGGVLAWRMAGARWAVLVAGALACATTVAPLHAGLYSEPLFLVVLLGWCLTIVSTRPAVVALAGGLAAVAFLVRFAGAALLLAGVVLLWSERRRLVAFVAGAAPLLTVWLLSAVAGAGATDRRLHWHAPTRPELFTAIERLHAWIDGHPGSSLSGVVVAAGSLLLLWQARRLPGGRSLGMLAACYLVVLGITVALLDAQTPLDGRLLAPLQVLVLLALPAISTVSSVVVRRVLGVGAALLVITTASATRAVLDPIDPGMLGVAGGPTVLAVGGLDGPLVSNAPGTLWLLGIDAVWLPKIVDPFTNEDLGDPTVALAALRADLDGGHVVWLDAFAYRVYLPTEEQVVAGMGLRLVERYADGAIYELDPQTAAPTVRGSTVRG